MAGLGLNPAFWQGKSVLVTGHTGFKGGWLSLWLQELGARAAGFSLPDSTQPNLFECADVGKSMNSHYGDLRDPEEVRNTLNEFHPEIIFHLAAQSLVREGFIDPLGTYATNVMGTANLLNTVRHTNSVRVVIVVTSDKCYENKAWPWGYREIDSLGGKDPYSSSKSCAEIVTAAYRHSFFGKDSGVSVASVRAGNVIGGGDWAKDRLIPDIFRSFEKNEPVILRYPQAVRPWQHVLEPLRGYLMLAEQLWQHGEEFTEAWNFGPDPQDAKSVAWLADQLAALWKHGARWDISQGKHPEESALLSLDSSKAGQRLGWRPKWHLEKSLVETYSWHRAWIEGRNMHDYTLAQILAYTGSPHVD